MSVGYWPVGYQPGSPFSASGVLTSWLSPNGSFSSSDSSLPVLGWYTLMGGGTIGFDAADGRGGGAGRGGGLGARLKPAISDTGLPGPPLPVGDMACLPFSVATRNTVSLGRRQEAEILTSVEVGLFSQFVVRVAVRVDRAVQLLKRHKSQYKLIVSVKQTSQPLLILDVMDLSKLVS